MSETPATEPTHKVLYVRVPIELKREVDAYADAVGITSNAAAVILLRAALREIRRQEP